MTAVDCGTLTNPVNGQVSHPGGTTFGQTATYSCNTGYNLVGDSTRTCQATKCGLGVHLFVKVAVLVVPQMCACICVLVFVCLQMFAWVFVIFFHFLFFS